MITLKEGRIIDQWSALLEQCQGHAEGLLQSIETNLKASEAPGISWKRESVAPGWLKGLFGKRRDFLLLTHERFKDHLMCVGARDYGAAMDVSWYLTASRKAAMAHALSLGGTAGAVAVGLWAKFTRRFYDVFDQQDLNAYVTVGHRAVLKAVEDLMEQRKLDVTRLDRKSRGVFAVS